MKVELIRGNPIVFFIVSGIFQIIIIVGVLSAIINNTMVPDIIFYIFLAMFIAFFNYGFALAFYLAYKRECKTKRKRK